MEIILLHRTLLVVDGLDAEVVSVFNMKAMSMFDTEVVSVLEALRAE